MDVRRQNIKISLNENIGIWELRYDNHPRVISYSGSWELLEEWSMTIVKGYFEELKTKTIETNTCKVYM